MPVLDKNNKNDVERLDTFLRTSEYGSFRQSFPWAEEKSDKWRNEFVYTEKDGKITAAALILIRDLAAGLTMFYCPRGPVANMYDIGSVEALIDEMKPLIKKYHPFSVKFDPEVAYDEELSAKYTERGFKVKSEFEDFLEAMEQPKNMVLKTEGLTEEEVMNKFAARTRYDVRQSIKRGVTVRCGDGEKDLDVFYDLMLETGKRQGIPVRSKEYFRHLLESFGESARLYIAEYEDKKLAASLAVNYGKRVTYFYGGSTEKMRDMRAAYALQKAMIQWAVETGCSYYDMGAVLNVDTNNGLYLFKIGFCKQEGVTNYIGEIDKVFNPVKYAVVKKGIPMAKKAIMKINKKK